MLTRTIITIGMLLALVVSAAMPRPARAASLADPPPLLNGTTKGKTVYSVPFVRNLSGDSAFCVACTSTQKTGGKTFLFGVEVLDNGSVVNDLTLGEGVTSLTPGDTDNVCTQDTAFFFIEVSIGDPVILQGAARVISEQKSMICAAYQLDPVGLNPSHFAVLPM